MINAITNNNGPIITAGGLFSPLMWSCARAGAPTRAGVFAAEVCWWCFTDSRPVLLRGFHTRTFLRVCEHTSESVFRYLRDVGGGAGKHWVNVYRSTGPTGVGWGMARQNRTGVNWGMDIRPTLPLSSIPAVSPPPTPLNKPTHMLKDECPTNGGRR